MGVEIRRERLVSVPHHRLCLSFPPLGRRVSSLPVFLRQWPCCICCSPSLLLPLSSSLPFFSSPCFLPLFPHPYAVSLNLHSTSLHLPWSPCFFFISSGLKLSIREPPLMPPIVTISIQEREGGERHGEKQFVAACRDRNRPRQNQTYIGAIASPAIYQ